MTVLRWILAGLGGFFAVGSLALFVVYMASGDKPWLQRTRQWRRLAIAVALVWFNLEIWRRVALIIAAW